MRRAAVTTDRRSSQTRTSSIWLGRPRASSAPAAGGQKPRGGGSRGKPRLDEMDVARARASARPWDRAVRYGRGQWFVHVKFGAGRVEEVTPDGFIVCLFEDGETRKLIHARPA
jgi:hypothetical protein